MWYFLSKLVGFVVTPYGVTLLVLFAGLFLKGKCKTVTVAAAVVCLWLTGSPWLVEFMVLNLEEKYPPVDIGALPALDAVHILGGGVGVAMSMNSDDPYNLGPAADRVVMGARIWRTGKVCDVIITGPACGESTIPFLADLGVSNSVVRVFESPRTTEEEARLIGTVYGRKTVAVVTTAIHMRRAMMLYEKYAPEINAIPVATDYIALPCKDRSFSWMSLVPNGDSMGLFNCALHEYLGYWARKW